MNSKSHRVKERWRQQFKPEHLGKERWQSVHVECPWSPRLEDPSMEPRIPEGCHPLDGGPNSTECQQHLGIIFARVLESKSQMVGVQLLSRISSPG